MNYQQTVNDHQVERNTPVSERKNGTVKWYNPEKAYGFIATEDGQDVFVHRTAISDGRPWLIDGQQVAFLVRQGSKGLEADQVSVTEDVAAIPPGHARLYQSQERPSNSGGLRERPRHDDAPRREREPYRDPLPAGPILATVVRCDPSGRFLFARAVNEGFDVYVHSSLFRSLRADPRAGDQFRITVEQSDRGLRARSLEAA